MLPMTTALRPLNAFEPLSRVCLHGLECKELNGSIANVLPPSSEAERQRLAETGRVKVSGYPKALSLRPENLQPASPANFNTPPLPFTALDIVRLVPEVAKLCREAKECGENLAIGDIGYLDCPHDFAEALWQVYCCIQPASMMPTDFISIVLDRPGHWLYWIGLEQVAHHIVIESCDGVWRGFQACKRAASAAVADNPQFASFAGVLVESHSRPFRGYSAREWGSLQTDTSSDAIRLRDTVEDDVIQQRAKVAKLESKVLDCKQAAAEARSVAAEAMSRAMEADLEAANAEARALEISEEARAAAEALAEAEKWLADNADARCAQVGTHVDAYNLWGGGRDFGRSEIHQVLELVHALKEQSQVIAEKLREQIHVEEDEEVADWAGRVLVLGNLSMTPSRPSTPRKESGQAESDAVWIFGDESSEPRCELTVPSHLAFPFMETFAKLTGEFPDAFVFLKILELAGWESLERDDGGCCGWTFRSKNLREKNGEGA
jgi:hypothetical protein